MYHRVGHRHVAMSIDDENSEKLQHSHSVFMNSYVDATSNATNVIVDNTQRYSAAAEDQTPTSSAASEHAFFGYPNSIFQAPPSASTLYGASPYSVSGYSEPNTPATSFPPSGFLAPYNSYMAPLELNMILPWTTAFNAVCFFKIRKRDLVGAKNLALKLIFSAIVFPSCRLSFLSVLFRISPALIIFIRLKNRLISRILRFEHRFEFKITRPERSLLEHLHAEHFSSTQTKTRPIRSTICRRFRIA